MSNEHRAPAPASPAAARLEEVEMKYQWASKERQDYYDQLIALRSTVARLTEERDRLRDTLDETVNYVGRNVVCVYPNCGCDGSRNCDAIRGPSTRATEQNIEGKINPAAAK